MACCCFLFQTVCSDTPSLFLLFDLFRSRYESYILHTWISFSAHKYCCFKPVNAWFYFVCINKINKTGLKTKNPEETSKGILWLMIVNVLKCQFIIRWFWNISILLYPNFSSSTQHSQLVWLLMSSFWISERPSQKVILMWPIFPFLQSVLLQQPLL